MFLKADSTLRMDAIIVLLGALDQPGTQTVANDHIADDRVVKGSVATDDGFALCDFCGEALHDPENHECTKMLRGKQIERDRIATWIETAEPLPPRSELAAIIRNSVANRPHPIP